MEVSSATSPGITIQVPPEHTKPVSIPVVNLKKLPTEQRLLLALKSSMTMNLQLMQVLQALSNNNKTEQEKPFIDFPSEPDTQPNPEFEAVA